MEQAGKTGKKHRDRRRLRIQPPPAFSGLRTELFGNRRAVVEGCAGILEYESETVRIRAGKMILCFKGRGLCIKCMDQDSLVVEGFILSLEYMT